MVITETMGGIGAYKFEYFANEYDPEAGLIDNPKRFLNKKYFFRFATKEMPFAVDHVKNKITNAALADIAARIGGISANAFTYLALGTSNTAVSAAHTALQAEITTIGLQRLSVTPTRSNTAQTNDTLNLAGLWTASGSTTLEEAGVLNASSLGTLLSRVLTTSRAVATGMTVRVTYTLQVVGN